MLKNSFFTFCCQIPKQRTDQTSFANVNNYIDAGVDAYFYIPARKFYLEDEKLLKTQEKSLLLIIV